MGVSSVFETFTPYPAAALGDVDYAQTNDRLYAAHLDYPMKRLTREDHNVWTWDDLDYSPGIDPPGNVAAAASQPNATGAIATDYTYYVTAIDAQGNESRASTPDTVSNDLSLPGNYNTITWDAATGAESYVVYRGDNNNPGYVGGADTTTFKDRNLLSIASDTPPRETNPFASTDNYPAVVGLHQQRLWAARTRLRPNGVWGSQSGMFENMDVSRPARPNDAISFALVDNQVINVNQLASLKKSLVVLNDSSVFAVSGGEGGALTPAAILPERQTGRGSSLLKPIAIDTVLFYQPAKSGEIRALGYSYEVEGLRTNNVAIFSSHLFKNRSIVCWAEQENPFSCIWAVRDDGVLFCFTWEEEQEVWGWTVMETGGFVEQCATISEGGYDRLYLLVRRTINGVERRFHEYMALPHTDLATACHLDCAVTQVSEEPSNVLEGLFHLEGETISVHADGHVFSGLVVENGAVTLPNGFEAYTRTGGLPYEGYIETLPPPRGSGGGETENTEPGNVGEVVIRALDTRGVEISLDGETWEALTDNLGGDLTQVNDISARDYPAFAPGQWSRQSTLKIRQTQPLPAHITGIFYEPIS